MSEYKDDVIIYMAGFVQRNIVKKEVCLECKIVLSSLPTNSSDLINAKNRGPLCHPSIDCIKICQLSYRVFQQRINEPDLFKETHLLDRLVLKVSMLVNMVHPQTLKALDTHGVTSHRAVVIKKIATLMLTTLLHHHCKVLNRREKSSRKFFSKLILFKHQ